MTPRAILARTLRDLRKAKDMSQEALAHEAGISRQYVSDLERELYAASIDTLESLAKVLKVRPSDLIDEDYAATPGDTGN